MTIFSLDPLEEWALHCQRRQASISLDSSGAPPPFEDEEWRRISFAPSNDEAEAEARLRRSWPGHTGR
jgi:hypothetical protein